MGVNGMLPLGFKEASIVRSPLPFSEQPMRFHRRFSIPVLIVAALALVFQQTADAQAAGNKVGVKYVVDLSDAKNHYLNITATIPVRGETTEMMMAVWTPGSYLVREYARHIDSLEVVSGGKKLEFEKTRKNRWVVQTKDIKSFQFRYRLYCNEMTVRTNWVGKQFAMINGAPTFVTVADRLQEKHAVRLKLPKNWKRSSTSLQAHGKQPHSFIAESFDELVDSPVVAGNVQVYPFSAGGVEHQLVNVGESGYWDGAKAAADLKQVVEAHQEMWKVTPYDRYLFLNMISESRGGLEHDFSTLIMTSRWSFRDKSRYQDWLSLASHEFFHTWNVRRLRPKPLVQYDYENEIYTDGLWIAEGITSYYEDLALVRAGLINRNEYLSRLSSNVESVQRTDGRKVQSLKESSYDTWIKFYRPDENSSNTRISYYSKGAVVAFLLDAKIRKMTGGKKSLDDVMRKLFNKHSENGFTSEDFRSIASEIAGEDLSDWFTRAIDSTEELDYSDVEILGVREPNKKQELSGSKKTGAAKEEEKKGDEKAIEKESSDGPSDENAENESKKSKRKKRKGAKLKAQKEKAQKEKAAQKEMELALKKEASETDAKNGAANSGKVPVAKPKSKPKPWLGITTTSNSGVTTITRVITDSPAADVGLSIGDEVIAINGFRVARGVTGRLSQFEVGDQLELLISRREQLLTIRVELGELESESWRLRYISKPSKRQKKQLDLWLGEKK